MGQVDRSTVHAVSRQTVQTSHARRPKRTRRVLAALGLSVGALVLSGCDLLGTPVESLPPCVDSFCDCSDFVSQDLAQLVLDAFKEDYYGLDRDQNGVACERVPQVEMGLDWATYFSNSEHLSLGNPSNAGQDNLDNLLIERDPYVLSYSKERNVLNWASWRVDAEWLGRTGRQDDFRTDGVLPKGVYQATPGEYRGSGYDRGHMVPSGDRTSNPRDNSLTFLMTNIFPQARENNRGPWRELEEHGRDLVYQQGKSLYVIGGVYGDKGDAGKVTIPGRVWKVMVVLDDADAPVTRATEVIAVDMPNSDRIESDWQAYRTTVDRIEVATGYDLLSDVPDGIQAAIESR
ncbi:MAG: DNA/RNA non-specific endonuclease [Cyanobacteria bacterium J06597_16]